MGFSMFENNHYFCDGVLSSYKFPISVLFKHAALVSQIYQHCIFLPASVPHWKSMTPVRDVHSFIFFFFFFACIEATSEELKRNIDELWRVHQQTAFYEKLFFFFQYRSTLQNNRWERSFQISFRQTKLSSEEVNLKW